MLRSYDSPARGGLQYPHRWGCVANTAGLKLLKSQGSRAEVRRMLQRLQPDRRGCFFVLEGGEQLRLQIRLFVMRIFRPGLPGVLIQKDTPLFSLRALVRSA